MARRPRVVGVGRRPVVVAPTRPVVTPPVVTPPVVTPPVEPARPVPPRPDVPARPRVTAGAVARERARVAKVITRIQKRAAKVDVEFYAMGQELNSLDRASVLEAFGAQTFHAFLDAHVMPVSTATRFMTVAREYSSTVASTLGVEKAFHLVQYAKVAQTRLAAEAMATRDSKIGSPARRVSELSAKELATLVQTLKLGAARAMIPAVTHRERKVAQRLVSEFEERYGVNASVRVDKKRGVVRIEAKLSDLLEG